MPQVDTQKPKSDLAIPGACILAVVALAAGRSCPGDQVEIHPELEVQPSLPKIDSQENIGADPGSVRLAVAEPNAFGQAKLPKVELPLLDLLNQQYIWQELSSATGSDLSAANWIQIGEKAVTILAHDLQTSKLSFIEASLKSNNLGGKTLTLTTREISDVEFAARIAEQFGEYGPYVLGQILEATSAGNELIDRSIEHHSAEVPSYVAFVEDVDGFALNTVAWIDGTGNLGRSGSGPARINLLANGYRFEKYIERHGSYSTQVLNEAGEVVLRVRYDNGGNPLGAWIREGVDNILLEDFLPAQVKIIPDLGDI